MRKRTVCISLDRALLARLDSECQEQDRSRSYLAAAALRQWFLRQQAAAEAEEDERQANHQTEPGPKS